VNANLSRYEALRELEIDPAIAPPMYFSPLVPGTALDRTAKPFRPGAAPRVSRPARLEDVAFWPLTRLAELVRTRQVTATDLTTMYLARLTQYNPTLNCVVSLTEDLALQQAAAADSEIAAGRYHGPLHGIPWGCKDIIAVPGYRTTWGSAAFKDQVIDTEATVVRLLREAGAVLVAKLATGELAGGHHWFGGRTNNPWNPNEGSSGSSAGPAAATAAGLVAFSIGSETNGSIIYPATVCGVAGLRPTFGRVSRHGVMTLSWTQDRLGPICRSADDCATVLHAIARPDENDLSVTDVPFNWDAALDVRQLRVGYLEAGFGERDRDPEWVRHDWRVLDDLRAIGVRLEPFALPRMPLEILSGPFGAESGAFFDAFLRSGRSKDLTSARRANGFRTSRLIPAVEYLQAQRVRAMVMRQFAEAVSRFDVYIAPFMVARGSTGDPLAGSASPAGAAPQTPPPPSAVRDHFMAANVCGYPALSVPTGFTREGLPTSIMFLGRLYNEAALLALARAYQERTGWHERTPSLG
jgi:Asp-tRNA(Asn)/Glu-tRNA(Gln) amidotransferase A subunit family amidase